MDTLLFKRQVQKNGDTIKSLAEAMGLHWRTLYMKYRDNDSTQQFTQSEIAFIAKRYKLTADDVAKIFFDDVI